ncbi:NAD(P)-dependent oxidoreductase [Derxia gummosa]|uniref:NAD(P)-dependent oxidoreductase n=1 Tax=Derxia gummosa DSM 723 TaxID=1121388 RepID=A0A8B6X417_9BURK|nr:NAD(P)-dependent oxidoreductase [Derxia gummosa]
MQLLLATRGLDAEAWCHALQAALPDARARLWQPGDDGPADYLLYWKADAAALAPRAGLRAIFNLGAGVDALLRLLAADRGLAGHRVPVLRLEDAGMARQMREYALYCALRFRRRFHDYEALAREARWQPLAVEPAEAFPVAVLGAGRLGLPVAQALAALGHPVRLWRRDVAPLPDFATFGADRLRDCVAGARLLVNLLPDTPATAGVLGRAVFDAMAPGGFLVNLARGRHVVDADLLAALDDGRLARAALDVFHDEPLPPAHAFWRHPRIEPTPHVAALTLLDDSVAQIAGHIARDRRGEPLAGIDLARGY